MQDARDPKDEPRTPVALPVVVELLGLGVEGGSLRWSVSRAALAAGETPDGLARTLAGPSAESCGTGVVLHSTSWRYAPEALTVTYALFPDPRSIVATVLEGHHLVTGPGPLHPSPTYVDEAHVAAHAVRHLADLAAGRDPHVVACAWLQPEAWRVLAAHAGRVHVEHPEPHVAGDRSRAVERPPAPSEKAFS